ncbi:MAG: hypothetical protein JNM79_08665 [Burkholderiales bacterium]|nr:hypothetical protein [Burkholderiales bacterium]
MLPRRIRQCAYRALLAIALLFAQQVGMVHAVEHASEHHEEHAPAHSGSAPACCLPFHAGDDAHFASLLATDPVRVAAIAHADVVATGAPPSRTSAFLSRAPPLPA